MTGLLDRFDEIWNWDYAAAALPQLLEAFLRVTLLATVLGSVIAAVLGLVVAFVRRSAPTFVAKPVHWVMEFVRMTPIVVQLLFVYYAFTS